MSGEVERESAVSILDDLDTEVEAREERAETGRGGSGGEED